MVLRGRPGLSAFRLGSYRSGATGQPWSQSLMQRLVYHALTSENHPNTTLVSLPQQIRKASSRLSDLH